MLGIFHDLGERQTRPDDIDEPSAQASPSVGKSVLKGILVSAKAVKGDIQRHFLRPASHDLGQGGDERNIPPWTDGRAQPQPRPDHDCHCHPDLELSLQLHPDFVGLHLAQIQGTNLGLMDCLGLASRSMLPVHDRSFIQAKGRHHRLARTAVGQQRHHLNDYFFLCPQSVEHRSPTVGEGSSTRLAFAPLTPLLPPNDIPFADHTLVSTPLVGAKYFLKVHFFPFCRQAFKG